MNYRPIASLEAGDFRIFCMNTEALKLSCDAKRQAAREVTFLLMLKQTMMKVFRIPILFWALLKFIWCRMQFADVRSWQ